MLIAVNADAAIGSLTQTKRQCLTGITLVLVPSAT